MSYEATHNFSSGGSVSGPADIVAMAARIDREMAEQERDWIVQLRTLGVKLAHPNDGWVNRSRNTLQPSYPQFDDNPAVGDLIALGSARDETLIVRVLDIESRHPLIGDYRIVTYWFDPDPVRVLPRVPRPSGR